MSLPFGMVKTVTSCKNENVIQLRKFVGTLIFNKSRPEYPVRKTVTEISFNTRSSESAITSSDA